ncbi:acyl CoA:acetate/3-ketoacid CoA transferase [Pseudovibrio exalbescens]|uniref:acyl CoA:acetate/3-ketoacid CoA transferase n=1 Tax=Pseudovibrio exalbescens TaxID=197461 RepID=UPI0023653D87|nr:CoA-transferase [Pseudovibrio exalbescens]MDD7910883.1 acyl CoA:acetate/3-ketoacid CoA transferase [Pseudovibrio exalbescens]
MAKAEFLSAQDAAALIKDGDTIAISGNGAGMISAEEILEAIETRFLETGHPRDLTLVHSLGLGDRDRMGTNRFAHEGMVKRVIAAHFTWSPKMQQLVRDEKVEAYCFPGGVVQHLLREIGAGRPGLFTHSGLGTFVDPRQQGGKCNARTTEDLVELMEVDGKEILRYKPFKVDVAIVRGTYADTKGNISPEEESIDMDIHSMALAAHNSGGLVLAQVRQVVAQGALHARHVRIPGIMVNGVVAAPEQPQFYGRSYDLTVSGAKRAYLGEATADIPAKLERRIIARRAALELKENASLNFGFGIPGGIFGVVAEQGIGDRLWMSLEQGIHNGRMLDDALFGAASNTDAIIPSIEQFDYYSGGGIDVTFLGMGEADRHGNVNVSHLGGNLIGPGGFIEIAQNAKKVVFCGTFDAAGAKVAFVGGKLAVIQPGKVRKFTQKVAAITFSGAFARQSGQEVLYITERAVFRLSDEGLEIIELAPGIEPERDIFPFMDFRPGLNLQRTMPEGCFL